MPSYRVPTSEDRGEPALSVHLALGTHAADRCLQLASSPQDPSCCTLTQVKFVLAVSPASTKRYSSTHSLTQCTVQVTPHTLRHWPLATRHARAAMDNGHWPMQPAAREGHLASTWAPTDSTRVVHYRSTIRSTTFYAVDTITREKGGDKSLKRGGFREKSHLGVRGHSVRLRVAERSAVTRRHLPQNLSFALVIFSCYLNVKVDHVIVS